MDESRGHYASEMRHSQKDILHESTYMRCINFSNSEAEDRMAVDGAWGQVEMGSRCSMGIKFPLYKMRKF